MKKYLKIGIVAPILTLALALGGCGSTTTEVVNDTPTSITLETPPADAIPEELPAVEEYVVEEPTIGDAPLVTTTDLISGSEIAWIIYDSDTEWGWESYLQSRGRGISCPDASLGRAIVCEIEDVDEDIWTVTLVLVELNGEVTFDVIDYDITFASGWGEDIVTNHAVPANGILSSDELKNLVYEYRDNPSWYWGYWAQRNAEGIRCNSTALNDEAFCEVIDVDGDRWVLTFTLAEADGVIILEDIREDLDIDGWNW